MFEGYIFQSPGGRQVGNRIARAALQNVIRNSNQGVFFTKRNAIFADQRQAIHIRIYGNAQVGVVLQDGCRKGGQVLRKWLGIVGKLPIGLPIDGDHLTAQVFQKLRHRQCA